MMTLADIEAPGRTTRPTSLQAVIAAAGCELSALARQGQRVQAVIAALVDGVGSSERTVEDAQLLDVLLQHQEALADVLVRLAAQIPPTAEVDLEPLLAGLGLSGLAERLAGGEGSTAGAAGELEVF